MLRHPGHEEEDEVSDFNGVARLVNASERARVRDLTMFFCSFFFLFPNSTLEMTRAVLGDQADVKGQEEAMLYI